MEFDVKILICFSIAAENFSIRQSFEVSVWGRLGNVIVPLVADCESKLNLHVLEKRL